MSGTDEVPEHVYKILRLSEWALLREEGSYSGSVDDQRDGFIHLSTAEQLAGTLEKHFHSEQSVIILKVRSTSLPIRMEPSRGGAFFPHLYGGLPLFAVEDWETKSLHK